MDIKSTRHLKNEVASEELVEVQLDQKMNQKDQEEKKKQAKEEEQEGYQVNKDSNDLNVINKDLGQVIQNKDKKRSDIKIQKYERWIFTYCYSKRDEIDQQRNLRQHLILAADKEIENKTEIFELWKELDELRLLKKILLNENQIYMIKNRELQRIIVNKEIGQISSNEISSLKEIENNNEKKSKRDLIEYLKSIKQFNKIDEIMLKYLDSNIMEEVKEEVNV